MVISEQELEERRKTIGGSDVPLILGLSDFGNASDVYAEKVYGLVPETKEAGYLKVGNICEPGIVAWCKEEMNLQGHLVTDYKATLLPDLPFHANMDAVVVQLDGNNVGIEAKTTVLREHWGEPGTDQVPTYVLIQVQYQMMVCRIKRIYVPVLFFGLNRDAHIYVVDAHAGLQAEIEKRLMAFWNDNVLAKVPPTESPKLATMKRVRRESRVVTLDPALLEEYEELQQTASAAREDADNHRADILKLMGDADVADFGDAHVTYYPNKKGHRSWRLREGPWKGDK